MTKRSKSRVVRDRESEEAAVTGRQKVIAALQSFGWFIAGAIFALFFEEAFVAKLPGPSISLMVNGVKPMAGSNAEKCIGYNLMSEGGTADIDHFVVRLWFPNRVEDFKIGFPEEAKVGRGEVMGRAWALSKTADGRCSIKVPANFAEGDVQASAGGNRLTIQSSKLPRHQAIMGIVVTSDTATVSGKAVMKMDGFYEYVKLGQTVRKPMEITFTGIAPLIEKKNVTPPPQ